MPDSGAVYQPTTVGYSYDNGVGGGFLGVGSVSRHKFNVKKWLEWALISAAVTIFAAGLLVTIIDVAASECVESNNEQQQIKSSVDNLETNTTNVKDDEELGGGSLYSDPSLVRNDDNDISNGRTIAVGVTLIIFGFILALIWGWLKFFVRNESPRNETSGGGGQMLGGLNPSTDLLVGSPSQYGPVLTEVPSHPKIKQSGNNLHLQVDVAASTLSDQEEETRTLMQETPSFNQNSNNANDNQRETA